MKYTRPVTPKKGLRPAAGLAVSGISKSKFKELSDNFPDSNLTAYRNVSYEEEPEQEFDVRDIGNASSQANSTANDMYEYLLSQRDELEAALAVLENAKEVAKDVKQRLAIVSRAIKDLAKLDQQIENELLEKYTPSVDTVPFSEEQLQQRLAEEFS